MLIGSFFLIVKTLHLSAQKNGYDVTVVTKDTGKKKDIEALGLKMIEFAYESFWAKYYRRVAYILFFVSSLLS